MRRKIHMKISFSAASKPKKKSILFFRVEIVSKKTNSWLEKWLDWLRIYKVRSFNGRKVFLRKKRENFDDFPCEIPLNIWWITGKFMSREQFFLFSRVLWRKRKTQGMSLERGSLVNNFHQKFAHEKNAENRSRLKLKFFFCLNVWHFGQQISPNCLLF